MNSLKNPLEKVKCDNCSNVFLRMDTLLVDTNKGRFRVCRECYASRASAKLNEEYKATKDNTKFLMIDEMDPYDIIKQKEQFIKNIRRGRAKSRN